MQNNRLNQSIHLRDGRTLGYAEYGLAEHLGTLR